MPEYEVKIKFHIFPYRKYTVFANDEKEAEESARDQAQQTIENIKFSIAGIKRKRLSMDDFLKEDSD